MLRNPEQRNSIKRIRPPAVADMFYPGNARKLYSMVQSLLQGVSQSDFNPEAIISPHAGYVYSGPVAATAFAPFYQKKIKKKRILVIGPSHRVAFRGFALPDAEVFETPLGRIPLDMEAIAKISGYPRVQVRADAHREEHSLEVQLPFMQIIFSDFLLTPILTGDCTPEEVARLLLPFLDDPDSLVVVSSDLSHYYDYNMAVSFDKKTAKKIEMKEWEGLHMEQACGSHAIAGLLFAAREKKLQGIIADLRNSGDTAGPRSQVVGYGAFYFLKER